MATQFEVGGEFLFPGRTFTEYCRMFGLETRDLVGRSVLDCPGGPSSFPAVASTICDRVVAADPMYDRTVGALEATSRDAIDRTVAQLHEKRDLYVWDEYGNVETRGRFLRAAAQRFLADYARHPGRYVQAGLPELPFETDAVDLVLSGNFLFLYDDRLSEDFHVASLRELARVAGEEVRVFPLHSLDRNRSRLLDPVLGRLQEAGLSTQLEAIPYEFQPGATEVLVLTDD